MFSPNSFFDDFSAFVTASPSAFHAAHEVTRRLQVLGFEKVDEKLAEQTPSRGVIVRDGAVVAWIQGDTVTPSAPFRIVGAHTDSPGFVVKPDPQLRSAGYDQVAVEVYGGPLLNSWLDRELELAGRLVTLDGFEHLVRSGPALRIPQLAVHLDREVNSHGLILDKQKHLQPLWSTHAGGESIVESLAEKIGIQPKEVGGFDLITVDSQAPARFGHVGEFFASPRLDNMSSVWAGMNALQENLDGAEDVTLVFVAFHHEEIGSESRSGALGPLLEDVLARLSEKRGASAGQHRAALASSWLISSDAGHAVHPNYADRHDPTHQPVLGHGPLLKVNATMRYATDAHGAAMWKRVAKSAGVATQNFVSHNGVPCGSTIGPLSSSRTGIRTVDVGTPLLSMHSAREMAHVEDIPALSRVLSAFYREPDLTPPG